MSVGAPAALVADSSALLAVVLGEPDAERLAVKLQQAERIVVSALTLFEASIAAERRGGLEAKDRLDRLLQRLSPEVVPFELAQLGWAREAWRRFGKGRHPAALNLGDCVAYATAQHAVLPLLFKGNDFSQTDVVAA